MDCVVLLCALAARAVFVTYYPFVITAETLAVNSR